MIIQTRTYLMMTCTDTLRYMALKAKHQNERSIQAIAATTLEKTVSSNALRQGQKSRPLLHFSELGTFVL